MKNGFTLVELAIVLVIIGLLIGGVLVGQSLIESAKINAQVRQFQQLDIAINNFREKFKGLPGDNKTFNLSIGINETGNKGNNNGVIEGNGNTSFFHDHFEFTNFWFQMSYTKMLPDTNYLIMHNGNATNNQVKAGLTLPKSFTPSRGNTNTQQNIGILAYGIPSLGKNYYSLVPNSNSPLIQRSMNALDAMPLDQKMDDGVGNTGAFVARSQNTSFENPADQTNSNCLDSAGKYRVTGSYINNYECTPRIEMFSQANSR